MGVDLTVEIGDMRLKNPVMVASGTFGYGQEYAEVVDVDKLGAIVTKGVGVKEWQGNAYPRLVETPCGLLNAVGLQNPGVEYFVDNYMPFLRGCDVCVVVNVWGRTVCEYVEVASRLDEVDGVDGIELNVSCPNIKEGGIAFGTDADMLRTVVNEVRSSVGSPLIVKLSPNVSDIGSVARICEEEGADAISLINSIPAMVIDVETRRPALSNIVGGLSGAAIHPVATRMVWQASQAVNIPVIGMGGVTGAESAIELILAGASAVAIGTANFADPEVAVLTVAGISEYMERHGFAAVSELCGAVRL